MSLLKLPPAPEPAQPETPPPPMFDAVLRFDLSGCVRTPSSAKVPGVKTGSPLVPEARTAVDDRDEALYTAAVAHESDGNGISPSPRPATEVLPLGQPAARTAGTAYLHPEVLAPEQFEAGRVPESLSLAALAAIPAPSLAEATGLRKLRGVESLRPVDCSLHGSRIRTESVAPWLAPQRPWNPRWTGELRRFDWAQLIARLADFEGVVPAGDAEKAKAAKPQQPARPMATLVDEESAATRIPVIGPLLAFWQSQSWLVRGIAVAIPVLALIALKPSFDGSLQEPVVLAKTLPPASSTVLRRMPSREQAAERGAKPWNKPAAAAPVASPEVPAAEAPAPVAKHDLPIATVEPRLTNVDRMLLARAAVELADDFSYGLDSWDSNSANNLTWSYDATGFIRPRGLALFRPSMSLTNYTVEFLAKIDAAAVGWVVRAVDHNNYHAVKIVQRGGGPLPRYTIVRYTVVDGREGPRIEHPLPLTLYKDTLFRIRMDIRGSNYSLLVQDSVVDSWSDPRFEFGGMGFFSGRGEESRIRWVQVTYQNDLLGKVCAWLAPKTS